MRSLTELIGMIGIGVSTIIVIIVMGLILLAVILIGIGAYESATNPHIANQTAQKYQQLDQNISAGQAAISGAVVNVTGGK
jgi:predicted negative regulator of RcsB-dependent stress response